MSFFKRIRSADRKEIVEKLKSKYKLMIINDETLEEKFSLLLSPANVFVWGGFTALMLIILTTIIIAFTPIREYIPGYSDMNIKRKATYASFKADSLEMVIAQLDRHLLNLKSVIDGKPIDLSQKSSVSKDVDYRGIQNAKTKEDSLLKNLIEVEDSYNVSYSENESGDGSLKGVYFFPPIKGMVSSQFSLDEKHFGIDIVADKDESIKSILDGTVVLSTWTPETGYILQIQHSNNLISVYKHNSILLKKEGERVRSGDAIAIIGNTGELSTGPHLHFELWHDGKAVDPQKFILF